VKVIIRVVGCTASQRLEQAGAWFPHSGWSLVRYTPTDTDNTHSGDEAPNCPELSRGKLKAIGSAFLSMFIWRSLHCFFSLSSASSGGAEGKRAAILPLQANSRSNVSQILTYDQREELGENPMCKCKA